MNDISNDEPNTGFFDSASEDVSALLASGESAAAGFGRHARNGFMVLNTELMEDRSVRFYYNPNEPGIVDALRKDLEFLRLPVVVSEEAPPYIAVQNITESNLGWLVDALKVPNKSYVIGAFRENERTEFVCPLSFEPTADAFSPTGIADNFARECHTHFGDNAPRIKAVSITEEKPCLVLEVPTVFSAGTLVSKLEISYRDQIAIKRKRGPYTDTLRVPVDIIPDRLREGIQVTPATSQTLSEDSSRGDGANYRIRHYHGGSGWSL